MQSNAQHINNIRKKNYGKKTTKKDDKNTKFEINASLHLFKFNANCNLPEWFNHLSLRNKIIFCVAAGLTAWSAFYIYLAIKNEGKLSTQHNIKLGKNNHPQTINNLNWKSKFKKYEAPCETEKGIVKPLSSSASLQFSTIPKCSGSKQSSETHFYVLANEIYSQFMNGINYEAISKFNNWKLINIDEDIIQAIKSHIIKNLIMNSNSANGNAIHIINRSDTKETTLVAQENIKLAVNYAVDLALQKKATSEDITMDELKTISNLILNGKAEPLPFRDKELGTECYEFPKSNIIEDAIETTLLPIINDKHPKLHPVVRNMLVNVLWRSLNPSIKGNVREASLLNFVLDLIDGYQPSGDLGDLTKLYIRMMKLKEGTKMDECLMRSLKAGENKFFSSTVYRQIASKTGMQDVLKNKQFEKKFIAKQKELFEKMINKKIEAYEDADKEIVQYLFQTMKSRIN